MRKRGFLWVLFLLVLLFLPVRSGQAAETAALRVPRIRSVKGDLGKITLTWKQVRGATNYFIFRKGGGRSYKRVAQLAASEGLSWEDTEVIPGTTYTYTMKALQVVPGRKKVVSELAKEVTGYAKIPAVTLGTAEAGDDGITISWEQIPGMSGYRIYRKEGEDTYRFLQEADRNQNSFLDTSVYRGIPYRYTVRAFVKEEDKVRLGEQNNTSVRATQPLPVQTLSAQAASGRVYLTWTVSGEIDGYRVYRREEGQKKYASIAWIPYATKFFFWDSTAVPGRTYEYVVRTYKTWGKKRYLGGNSNVFAVRCLPGNVILTGVTREKDRDLVAWQAVKGCSSYVIYKRNRGTKWKWTRAAVVKAGQTSKHFPREEGTTYYTVRAGVAAGDEILLSPRFFPLDNAVPAYTQQKVLFAGDSITWGFCWNAKRKRLKVRYADRAAQLTGIDYDCYGFVGSSVTPTNGIRLYRHLLRKGVKYSRYSLVVLECGTNDYSRGVPLGSLSDTSFNTFYGAWNELLSAIKEANPEVKILLVLPTFRQRIGYTFFQDARYVKNAAGLTLNQYAAAMKKVARKHGAEVFDPWEAGALTKKDGVLLKDAIHPTEEGHILLGDALAEKMKSMMPRDPRQPSPKPEPEESKEDSGRDDGKPGEKEQPAPTEPEETSGEQAAGEETSGEQAAGEETAGEPAGTGE